MGTPGSRQAIIQTSCCARGLAGNPEDGAGYDLKWKVRRPILVQCSTLMTAPASAKPTHVVFRCKRPLGVACCCACPKKCGRYGLTRCARADGSVSIALR